MSSSRYGHIDSLRAIAALLVVWLHSAEIFLAPASRIPNQRVLFDSAFFFDYGRIGVVVFFIISGFVIPSSLRGERSTALKQFAIKRFFRLYPLYWASIPLGLITFWWIWGKSISLSDIVANLTMIQGFFGVPLVIGLYWTLATELLFYGICAGLFYIGALHSERWLAVILLGLLAVSFTFFNFPNIGSITAIPELSLSREWSYTWSYIGFMFLGAIYRRYYENGDLSPVAKFAFYAFIATWAWQSIYAIYSHFYVTPNFELIKHTLRYNIAIILFFACANKFRITSKTLAYLGTISYSIYLLHPVALYSLFYLTRFEAFASWSLLTYILATMTLTIGLSAVTYRFIEKPCMTLGNYLCSRGGSKRNATAVA